MKNADGSLANLHKEAIKVRHSELERSGEVSAFRSKCPVCKKGVLLVGRDQKTLQLRAEDICVHCGQRFIYTDIEEMRRAEGR